MAADIVGQDVGERNRLYGDMKRVRKLLANAPADRVWRRRGYFVLCCAHPNRVQQPRVCGSEHVVRYIQRISSEIVLARADTSDCKGSIGCCLVDEKAGDDWTGVLWKVLGLQEDDIFRTIVGYL